jgi:uncharacterized phage infection (PIP) family protein YhgE
VHMANNNREFTKTEIKAGLIVIASIAVFLGFFAVINGWRPAVPSKHFFVRLDNTIGLHHGSQVRFGGKDVGKVESLDLDTSDQSRIRVELKVDAETPVNAKSQAFITSVSLTAENHLEITTGEKDAPILADGEEIPATVGGLFGAVAGVATGLSQALEDVRTLLGVPAAAGGAQPSGDTASTPQEQLVTVHDVLQGVDGALGDASEIIVDMKSVVRDRNADLESILGKVKEIEDGTKDLLSEVDAMVKENRENIGTTVTNVKDTSAKASEISGKLAQRFDTLADSLQATLVNVQGASGDAKGLLDDQRPQIEDMIADLREMVRYLKQFSRTISEQPQAVIRGQEQQGRKAK